jgi:hypothetical protein
MEPLVDAGRLLPAVCRSVRGQEGAAHRAQGEVVAEEERHHGEHDEVCRACQVGECVGAQGPRHGEARQLEGDCHQRAWTRATRSLRHTPVCLIQT